jgi:peptidoglycan/xylan/chitin deacetylase (PgdA/CDA1 family)
MRFYSSRRLSILIYHRVLDQPDPLFPGEVDVKIFDRHLSVLKRFFTIMPLLEATHRLRNHNLPRGAACITFDDGYADNEQVALPILQRHGLSACFFVATGYLDGGIMWNDRVIEHVRHTSGSYLDLSAIGLGYFLIDSIYSKARAIADILEKLKYMEFGKRQKLVEQLSIGGTDLAQSDIMMSSNQVKILHRAGMEIGAHTVHHPILATMSDSSARADIADGKQQLERIIGTPVRLFAYPNGKPGKDYGQRDIDLVRNLGFDAAVATHWGTACYGCDPFQLPRFTPWDHSKVGFFLRLQKNILSRTS